MRNEAIIQTVSEETDDETETCTVSMIYSVVLITIHHIVQGAVKLV